LKGQQAHADDVHEQDAQDREAAHRVYDRWRSPAAVELVVDTQAPVCARKAA
jgi:hypothetical protein